MDVPRIRHEIQEATQHFPNIEAYATTSGGLFIKAVMQTSVGHVYVIQVTFEGYPSAMPKVLVVTPAVTHSTHIYTDGHICYMHPLVWNPGKHRLLYVLAQTAVWLNKHEIFKIRNVWPGPGLPH